MNTLLGIIVLISTAAFFHERSERLKLRRRLNKYDNLESKENFEFDLERKIQSREKKLNQLEHVLDDLRKSVDYHQSQLGELQDEGYFHSFGFYKPSYELENAEEIKSRLDAVRDEQKLMIKNGTAAICHTEWQVEGSRRKGKKMTNDFLRLVLMAFNGTCDAEIPNVKYNNIHAIEKKINRIFDKLNKLSETTHAEITVEYLNLKIKELSLLYEYREKNIKNKKNKKE